MDFWRGRRVWLVGFRHRSQGVLNTAIARFLLEDFEQRGMARLRRRQTVLYDATHWKVLNRQMRAWVQDLDGVFIGRKRITANKAFIDGVINEFLSMCEASVL